MVGAVQCLLANLYMVLANESTSPSSSSSSSSHDGLLSTGLLDENWQPTQTTGDTLQSITIKALMHGRQRDVARVTPPKKAHRRRTNTMSTAADGASSTTVRTKNDSVESTVHDMQAVKSEQHRLLPNCSTVDDCCKRTLEHVHEGLQCVRQSTRDTNAERASRQSSRRSSVSESTATPADRNHPIPLPHSRLFSTSQDANRLALIPYAVRQPQQSGWEVGEQD